MLKKTLTAFTLSFLSLLGNGWENYAAQPSQKTSDAPTSTLQKMIVENGSVTMELDLNGLNGSSSLVARPITLHFAAAANSFFTILVFNDLLRGPEPGSIALAPTRVNVPCYNNLPVALAASLEQLIIEKLPSDQPFDLTVRDGKTGSTFFNIDGHQYNYDANAQLLSITGGTLRVSKEFANALGHPSEAGAPVGKISLGATMQPIEVQTVVNGKTKSIVMPPVRGATGAETPTLVPCLTSSLVIFHRC